MKNQNTSPFCVITRKVTDKEKGNLLIVEVPNTEKGFEMVFNYSITNKNKLVLQGVIKKFIPAFFVIDKMKIEKSLKFSFKNGEFKFYKSTLNYLRSI